MENKKHLIWIGLGTVITFLLALLALIVYQAIIWGPTLVEIASVTWNDGPRV